MAEEKLGEFKIEVKTEGIDQVKSDIKNLRDSFKKLNSDLKASTSQAKSLSSVLKGIKGPTVSGGSAGGGKGSAGGKLNFGSILGSVSKDGKKLATTFQLLGDKSKKINTSLISINKKLVASKTALADFNRAIKTATKNTNKNGGGGGNGNGNGNNPNNPNFIQNFIQTFKKGGLAGIFKGLGDFFRTMNPTGESTMGALTEVVGLLGSAVGKFVSVAGVFSGLATALFIFKKKVDEWNSEGKQLVRTNYDIHKNLEKYALKSADMEKYERLYRFGYNGLRDKNDKPDQRAIDTKTAMEFESSEHSIKTDLALYRTRGYTPQWIQALAKFGGVNYSKISSIEDLMQTVAEQRDRVSSGEKTTDEWYTLMHELGDVFTKGQWQAVTGGTMGLEEFKNLSQKMTKDGEVSVKQADVDESSQNVKTLVERESEMASLQIKSLTDSIRVALGPLGEGADKINTAAEKLATAAKGFVVNTPKTDEDSKKYAPPIGFKGMPLSVAPLGLSEMIYNAFFGSSKDKENLKQEQPSGNDVSFNQFWHRNKNVDVENYLRNANVVVQRVDTPMVAKGASDASRPLDGATIQIHIDGAKDSKAIAEEVALALSEMCTRATYRYETDGIT